MDEGISSGLKQVRDYGVKLPESFQNPPIFESTFTSTGDTVLDTANRYAAMYDYDKAIETIQAMRVMQSIQRLLRNMILKSPVYSSGMTTTQLHIFSSIL